MLTDLKVKLGKLNSVKHMEYSYSDGICYYGLSILL